MPQSIVYTSIEGAVSDATITLGSTSYGTDNTTILQAILNKALTGPLIIFWDGKYSVSNTLKIYSNTTIYFLSGCGIIARPLMDKAIFMNANPSTTTTHTDKNISFLGVDYIINGNGQNQTHHNTTVGWINPIKIIGADHITVKGMTIITPRTFHIWFMNCNYITIEDLYLDYGPGVNATDVFGNFDGVHINGPSQFINILNCTTRTFDDCIALNADDIWQNTNPTGIANGQSSYDPYACYGDITDVNINNITLMPGSGFGFRLLSAASGIDRVHISNVKGSTILQAFIIDNWHDGAAAHTGVGNIGEVVLQNISLEVLPNGSGYFYKNCYINIGCVIKKLTITNMTRKDFTATTYPTINIDSFASVENLTINNLTHTTGVTSNQAIVLDGVVKNLTINNAYLNRYSGGQITFPLVKITTNGNCKRLQLSNIDWNNADNVIEYSAGNVDYISATNLAHISNTGTLNIASGKTLKDYVLSNYYGGTRTIGSGTITGSRGDGFTGTLPTA